MNKRTKLNKAAKVGFAMTTLAIMLAGCGGGSGGAIAPVVVPQVIQVADGYVKWATVKFDMNADGSCGDLDGKENLTVNQTNTDVLGNFSYPANVPASAVACASGGIDISTGQPLVGELKAPAGSTVITPLTTLVQAYMQSTSATSAVAAAAIATNLGISSATPILTTDPVSNPALAQKTATVQQMLVDIATLTANVVAAAGLSGNTANSDQVAALFGSSVSGLASAVASAGSPVNLSSANSVISTAITNTVSNAKAASSSLASVFTLTGSQTALLSSASGVSAALVATNYNANAIAATATNFMAASAAVFTSSNSGASAVSAAGTADLTSLTNFVRSIPVPLPTATSLQVQALVDAINQYNPSTGTTTAIQTAAAAAAGVSSVAVAAPALNALILSLPKLNNNAVDTTSSPYKVAVNGPLSSASIAVTVDGTIGSTTTAQLGLKVAEVGGNRSLMLVIDNMSVSSTGSQVAVAVTPATKLSVYGTDSKGNAFSLPPLSNVSVNILSILDGGLVVNWVAAATALSNLGFTDLAINNPGAFDISIGVSGVAIEVQPAALPIAADAVTFSIPVSGNYPSGLTFNGNGAKNIRTTVK